MSCGQKGQVEGTKGQKAEWKRPRGRGNANEVTTTLRGQKVQVEVTKRPLRRFRGDKVDKEAPTEASSHRQSGTKSGCDKKA